MELHEKDRNLRYVSFHGVRRFPFLIVALALTVAVSLSVAAQIVPSPPVLLNTNGASDVGPDESPQVTTDGAGNWVAVWESRDDLGGAGGLDFDIFVATSTDNGATWTAPVLLNTNGASDHAHDFEPQVTTDGLGNWVAVWDSSESMGISTDRDISVARSTDNGATWTAPALLNTNGAGLAQHQRRLRFRG